MSKKGDHPLLRRLLTVVDQRLRFAAKVSQLRQQRQWLIDLDERLDPASDQGPATPTSQSVAQAVDTYLSRLSTQIERQECSQTQAVAVHLIQTVRNHWWGLFTCYDVEGLPRTNNELETFFRRIKMGQRRISGLKHVHDYIIRYGPFLACIDYREPLDTLMHRLHDVAQQDFLAQRQLLNSALGCEQKRRRFHLHRSAYLHELEDRWSQAVANDTS